MKSALAKFLLATAMAITLVGCNRSQKPTTGSSQPQGMTVTPGNTAEMAAVTAAETAKANYLFRLTVLHSYYMRTGNMDKATWAQNEINNLKKAQTFQWVGIPEITPPPGESLAGVDEHMLVEYVISARRDYLNAMRNLLTFYRSKMPDAYKAQRVAEVLDRFDPVYTYKYFLEAELPPATTRCAEVIPEANKMFDQALRLYREGKGLIPYLGTSYSKEHEALLLFLDLVHKYPQSTKVPEAAYYIGEIYKEYYNENIRAVAWYLRAVQLDPNLTKPARFQAAVVEDLRLYNRAKAIELYRQVIQHEQFNASNVKFAHNRIRELTGS